MRVALFSESPSDEAALKVLVEGILGRVVEPVGLNLRSRGWPAVRYELRAVVRELWLNQKADGLVVSVDTDHSPVHEHGHVASAQAGCRQCVLQRQADETVAELRAKHPRPALVHAVASASPAVEAWLLHGTAGATDEGSWKVFLLTNPDRFKVKLRVNDLKRSVYGTPKPGQAAAIHKATEEARRIVADLTGLSAAFPGGFGLMAEQVACWETG